MSTHRCEYCGAIVGGYEECRSIFNQVTAQSLGSTAYFFVHRAVVDCYALQHPEYFCVSAKSYAAHLSGLCVAIEYNRSVEVNAAIQKWLSGSTPALHPQRGVSVDLDKPKVLTKRGELTVTHVHDVIDPQERARRVNEWCNSVWIAYNELHDIARSYVHAALAMKKQHT